MTNYECTKEKECPTCQKQGIKASSDPDSSDKAWDYYKHVYKDERGKFDKRLEFLNKLNEDEKNDTKYQLKGESNRLIAETAINSIPNFGGDTFFNFKYQKPAKGIAPGKYQSFENIISNFALDKEEKAELCYQLTRCAKNHHSLLNFSLMPSTGGLNNVKGSGYDTPCIFFEKLNKYLCIPKPIRSESISIIFKYTFEIFNQATYLNLPVIKNFLDKFDSLDDYCKTFYNIDKTSKYLKLSKEKVSDKWLKDYMTLAEDYWEMRHKQLQGVISDNSEKCKPKECVGHTYTISGTENEIVYFYMPKKCENVSTK